jgi:hypothetical protein
MPPSQAQAGKKAVNNPSLKMPNASAFRQAVAKLQEAAEREATPQPQQHDHNHNKPHATTESQNTTHTNESQDTTQEETSQNTNHHDNNKTHSTHQAGKPHKADQRHTHQTDEESQNTNHTNKSQDTTRAEESQNTTHDDNNTTHNTHQAGKPHKADQRHTHQTEDESQNTTHTNESQDTTRAEESQNTTQEDNNKHDTHHNTNRPEQTSQLSESTLRIDDIPNNTSTAGIGSHGESILFATPSQPRVQSYADLARGNNFRPPTNNGTLTSNGPPTSGMTPFRVPSHIKTLFASANIVMPNTIMKMINRTSCASQDYGNPEVWYALPCFEAFEDPAAAFHGSPGWVRNTIAKSQLVYLVQGHWRNPIFFVRMAISGQDYTTTRFVHLTLCDHIPIITIPGMTQIIPDKTNDPLFRVQTIDGDGFARLPMGKSIFGLNQTDMPWSELKVFLEKEPALIYTPLTAITTSNTHFYKLKCTRKQLSAQSAFDIAQSIQRQCGLWTSILNGSILATSDRPFTLEHVKAFNDHSMDVHDHGNSRCKPRAPQMQRTNSTTHTIMVMEPKRGYTITQQDAVAVLKHFTTNTMLRIACDAMVFKAEIKVVRAIMGDLHIIDTGTHIVRYMSLDGF